MRVWNASTSALATVRLGEDEGKRIGRGSLGAHDCGEPPALEDGALLAARLQLPGAEGSDLVGDVEVGAGEAREEGFTVERSASDFEEREDLDGRVRLELVVREALVQGFVDFEAEVE